MLTVEWWNKTPPNRIKQFKTDLMIGQIAN